MVVMGRLVSMRYMSALVHAGYPLLPGLRRNSVYPSDIDSPSGSSALGQPLAMSELSSSESDRIPSLPVPKIAPSLSSCDRVLVRISVPLIEGSHAECSVVVATAARGIASVLVPAEIGMQTAPMPLDPSSLVIWWGTTPSNLRTHQ
jgi:hypothetical protein